MIRRQISGFTVRGYLALALFALLALTCGALPMKAHAEDGAMADKPVYAVLYGNGDLVVKNDNQPEPNRGVIISIVSGAWKNWNGGDSGYGSHLVFGDSEPDGLVGTEDREFVRRVEINADIVVDAARARWFEDFANVESIGGAGQVVWVDLEATGCAYYGIFSDCTLLRELDLSSWKVGGGVGISLCGCDSLDSLTLRKNTFNWKVNGLSAGLSIDNRDENDLWVEAGANRYCSGYELRAKYCSSEESADTVATYHPLVREAEPYALLYLNGDLVFQNGNEPDEIRGDLVNSWADVENGIDGWKGQSERIRRVVFQDLVVPNNVSWWFNTCSNLESVGGIENLNLSRVRYMHKMFRKCSSLKSLDLSPLDTSSVTSMGSLFEDCDSLESVNLSGWDTSSVTEMGEMFYGCAALTSLDVSGFDTSSVTDMQSMFEGCASLDVLDVSRFDTSNVGRGGSPSYAFRDMFAGCEALRGLNVTSFDTRFATALCGMFRDCRSLELLDLSSFDTRYVTSVDGLFSGCDSLASLDVSSFDLSNVSGGEGDSGLSNLPHLKEVHLGQGWSFKGPGRSEFSQLPAPPDEPPYTGKWVNADIEGGEAYTSAELADKWDSATMAGVYKWEEVDEPYFDVAKATIGKAKPLYETENLAQWGPTVKGNGVGGGLVYAWTGEPLRVVDSVECDGLALAENAAYEVVYYRVDPVKVGGWGWDVASQGVALEECVDEGAYWVSVRGVAQCVGERHFRIQVTRPEHDLANALVAVTSEFAFTGSRILPSKTAVVTLNGRILNEGVDYYAWESKYRSENPVSLTWDVNHSESCEAGHFVLTVFGASGYYGEKMVDYRVVKQTSADNALVTGVRTKVYTSINNALVTGVRTKVYTGKALTQSPRVKLGNKVLKKVTDYTLEYRNNKRVGTATVIVKGKGSYTGTVSKTFRINPKGTSILKITAARGGFTAAWKKQPSKTSGYQVQWCKRADFKSGAKAAAVTSPKVTSKKVARLGGKAKYYVRVRTYKKVGKTKYYSAWSAAKAVTTKAVAKAKKTAAVKSVELAAASV